MISTSRAGGFTPLAFFEALTRRLHTTISQKELATLHRQAGPWILDQIASAARTRNQLRAGGVTYVHGFPPAAGMAQGPLVNSGPEHILSEGQPGGVLLVDLLGDAPVFSSLEPMGRSDSLCPHLQMRTQKRAP